MSVYVDEPVFPWRGKLWCHLEADTTGELHEFAQRLGLRREWFQDKPGHPHYDITASVRVRAVRLGAIELSMKQMAEFYRRVASNTNQRRAS